MLLWNMSLTSRCICSLCVYRDQAMVPLWAQPAFLASVVISSLSVSATLVPSDLPIVVFLPVQTLFYQYRWTLSPPPYFAPIKSPFFTNRRTFIFPVSFFKYQIMAFENLSKQKVQFFIVTATALMSEPETPNDLFLMIFEEAPCSFKTCQNDLFWHCIMALVYVSS